MMSSASGGSSTTTPNDELARRHERLRPGLAAPELDLTIIATSPNLYYLTGSTQEGMLVISPHLPGPVYLVRRVPERARRESALEDVRQAVSPRKVRDLLGLGPVRRIGLELDSVPYGWALRLRDGVAGKDAELVDVSATLRQVRSVKSPWEVDRIQEAAAQLDAAMARAAEVMREGMTELELSAELESTMRKLGHEGLVRMHRFGSEMHFGGVLSGPSATVPTNHQAVMGGTGLSPSLPHGASRRRIGRGEPVAIDMCAVSRGYIADQTRTFVIGDLPEEAQAAMEATQDILRLMERELRPGAGAEDLWLRAEARAGELGVAGGFMGVGPTKLPFIGHGVGLELDELPVLAARQPGELSEGAVVAIEPKVVIPGVGVPGEENTYHVTTGGARALTRSPPGPIRV